MPEQHPRRPTGTQAVFLVEADANTNTPSVLNGGDESIIISIAEVRGDLWAGLKSALANLEREGVRGLVLQEIGHSALVDVQHATYHQLGKIIAALKVVGEVTIQFPDR